MRFAAVGGKMGPIWYGWWYGGWAGVTSILVVDADVRNQDALGQGLGTAGYSVTALGEGSAALRAVSESSPDFVVVDIELPDMDGIDFIRALRCGSAVPVIVLSHRAGGVERLGAFEAGVDDFLAKPFGMVELLARIRAVSRRAAGTGGATTVVKVGRFRVDLTGRRVTDQTGGKVVDLTPTQWGVLEVLLRNPGRLVRQERLLGDVWGPRYLTETGYLRQYLAQLRRKLEDEPARPRHLITEPGVGYRFQP